MASKTAESFSFETKEGEAEIVYGDMSVAAVQLPPHLRYSIVDGALHR